MPSESGLAYVGVRVDAVRVIVDSLRDSWSEPLNPFMLIDMSKRVQYSLVESPRQFFALGRVKNDSAFSG
jgi:hypothetical protein